MDSGTFTDLERDVINLILSADDPEIVALRAQFEHATVTDRRMTGVGFYCDIATPDAAALPNHSNFELSNVSATIPAIAHGAGFVLFVRDGRLKFLEGFTYDEPWPDHVAGYSLARID